MVEPTLLKNISQNGNLPQGSGKFLGLKKEPHTGPCEKVHPKNPPHLSVPLKEGGYLLLIKSCATGDLHLKPQINSRMCLKWCMLSMLQHIWQKLRSEKSRSQSPSPIRFVSKILESLQSSLFHHFAYVVVIMYLSTTLGTWEKQRQLNNLCITFHQFSSLWFCFMGMTLGSWQFCFQSFSLVAVSPLKHCKANRSKYHSGNLQRHNFLKTIHTFWAIQKIFHTKKNQKHIIETSRLEPKAPNYQFCQCNYHFCQCNYVVVTEGPKFHLSSFKMLVFGGAFGWWHGRLCQLHGFHFLFTTGLVTGALKTRFFFFLRRKNQTRNLWIKSIQNQT